jgi:DNA-binding response OmpR family regulator
MAQKVAIIEDEPSIAQLYQFKFEKEGYKVLTAINGTLGLALIQQEEPDIVLLDLLMPEMGGEEMLAKMRATDWGKDIKVIILTNVSRMEAPESLNELGISRYIVKAEMTASQVAQIVKEELAKVRR